MMHQNYEICRDSECFLFGKEFMSLFVAKRKYDDTQNYPFCRLQLVIETFGHSTELTNYSKFNKSPQSCSANE